MRLTYRAGKTSLPLTDEWRQSVRAALVRIGHNQSWLAEQLGCSRQAVHEALTTAGTSTLRADVDRVLGLPSVVDPLQPRGPKEGPAWPASDDWKHAVMVALDERGWNQSDLARELAPDVEATPAAISYMLTKAKQTSLRPFIDKLLGLAPHTATLPQDDAHLLAELLTAWNTLTPANRARVVERAKALLEIQ